MALLAEGCRRVQVSRVRHSEHSFSYDLQGAELPIDKHYETGRVTPKISIYLE